MDPMLTPPPDRKPGHAVKLSILLGLVVLTLFLAMRDGAAEATAPQAQIVSPIN